MTCDVINDFANDGVVYLELRSTPRAIPQWGVTQASYMETILRAIRDKTATFDDLQEFNVRFYAYILMIVFSLSELATLRNLSQLSAVLA